MGTTPAEPALTKDLPRRSVREGPQAQFFATRCPQARDAVRFDDQEKHDQRTEDDEFDMGHQGDRNIHSQQTAHQRQHLVEEDRQDHDEGRG